MRTLKEKLDYLRTLESGWIVDVFLKLGIENYSITGLANLGRGAGLFVGVAHTAQMGKVDPESEAPTYSRFDCIHLCNEGDVLVTAGASGRIVVGDIFVAYAAAKKLSAWVIDGLVRDAGPISKLDITVSCEGASNHLWRHGTRITALDVPVEVRGTRIRPGDIIVSDLDGILVIPFERLDEVIYEVEYVAQVEGEVPAIFAAGVDLQARIEDVDRRKMLRRPAATTSES
jgi:4-hydroxy-4-methyl-2-oxoglutarate aldolase